MEALHLTLAITGASGVMLAREALRALETQSPESQITSAQRSAP